MPKRSWLQFRLRTLFLAVTAISLLLGLAGVQWYRDYQRDRALGAIRDLGGRALSNREGRIDRVYLGGPQIGDAELANVAPWLHYLRHLKEIDLVRNSVTDEGLFHLSRLAGLEELYVFETRISEAGVERLQESLPDLEIKLEEPDPIATMLASIDVYRHAVTTLAFEADGEHLISGSGDGRIRRWELSFESEPTILDAHSDWLFATTFSPNGKLLATGGGDDRIKIWDARSLQERARFDGHEDDVHAVAFSPDARWLYSASDDGTVRRWDVETGAMSILGVHFESIPALAVSPRTGFVASGSRDNTIQFWDNQGRRLGTLDGHNDDVMSIEFHPDGNRLASASYDGTIRLWDLATGSEVGRLTGHAGRVFAISFSPDGQIAASAGEDGIRLWDVEQGSALHHHGEPAHVACIRFHDDGQSLFAAAADGYIYAASGIDQPFRRRAAIHHAERGILPATPLGTGPFGSLRAWIRLSDVMRRR